MVTLCEGTPESTGKLGGRGPRLWAFGYEALAKLFGMTEGAVRQAVYDGRLDPSDLEAVCQSWMRYHEGAARAFIYQRDAERENPTYSPEEIAMIESMRAQVAFHAREHRLTPEQEVEEMKRRCREAPFLRTGPTPADLGGDKPDLEQDPEIRGLINARCAEAVNRTRAKCPACGLDVEVHTPEGILDCMDKLTGPHGPRTKVDLPDPDVPF